MTEFTWIPTEDIHALPYYHPRAQLYEETVEEYKEAILAGAKLPPIIVFSPQERAYILADGWHRLEAVKRAGRAQIAAEIRPGSPRDATLYAVGANQTHGLRRTPDDKRRAVEILLRDEEWSQWSNRQIAEAAAVSHTFVAHVKATGNVASSPERTIGKDHKSRPATRSRTGAAVTPAATPKAQLEANEAPPGQSSTEEQPAAKGEVHVLFTPANAPEAEPTRQHREKVEEIVRDQIENAPPAPPAGITGGSPSTCDCCGEALTCHRCSEAVLDTEVWSLVDPDRETYNFCSRRCAYLHLKEQEEPDPVEDEEPAVASLPRGPNLSAQLEGLTDMADDPFGR